ncbi:hypothetical protein QFZ31_006690 [Neobacillus niacini]|uniref:hypothetical protein n=1 Tax=Neobacillus driksii TaxID=3035913 RepID=UPI0027846C37|nr:hypothetical protein [Neobacillus niacini]MDQ0976638.1 hypothetical protein [Neobacillus niacini]
MELSVIEVNKKGRKGYKDSEGNIYMECSKCSEIKKANEFSKSKKVFMGLYPQCKECHDVDKQKYREENKQYFREYSFNYYRENQEELKEKSREWSKGYREKNREVLLKKHRVWQQANRDKIAIQDQRRRARKNSLPATLTMEEGLSLGNECVLTGSTSINLDHVIPLYTGYGGTIYENMIPLDAKLNSSKNNKNVFEWAIANHQRLNFTLDRFYEVMTEVADRNNMTLGEYREYVYWCFENKRELATV